MKSLGLLLFFFGVLSAFAQDEVIDISDPAKAAIVRLDLVRNAKSEILMETYILHDDFVGRRLLAELREASRRGVKVVLLQDGLNTSPIAKGVSDFMFSHLVNEGMDIYDFNQLKLFRPDKWGYRNHRKNLIVDGTYLLTGDRNTSKSYYGLDGTAYQSREVLVKGSSAAEARTSFNEMLKSSPVTKRSPDLLRSSLGFDREAAQLSNSLSKASVDALLPQKWDWQAEFKPVTSSGFIGSTPGPIGKGVSRDVTQAFLDGIRRSKTSILIVNPYIQLTPEFREALSDAAQRGVQVVVHTNSIESMHSNVLSAAWESSRSFLAEIGAEVWEHPGEDAEKPKLLQRFRSYFKNQRFSSAALHEKTMVIDNIDVFVGSYNLDPRSAIYNAESVYRATDEVFAKCISVEIETNRVERNFRQVASGGKLYPENYKNCPWLYRQVAKVFRKHL